MGDDLNDSGIEDNNYPSLQRGDFERVDVVPVPVPNFGSDTKIEAAVDFFPEISSTPAAWLLEHMDDIRLETLKSHFFPNGQPKKRTYQYGRRASFRGIGLTKDQFATAVCNIIGTKIVWEQAAGLHDLYSSEPTDDSVTESSTSPKQEQSLSPRLLYWEQIVDAFLEDPSESGWIPLGTPQIFRTEHSKREPIVRVIPVQTPKSFCYVVVSRWGRVGVYDATFKLLESYRVKLGFTPLTAKMSVSHKFRDCVKEGANKDVETTGERKRGLPWINDVLFLPDALSLIFLCSDSSLQIWSAEWLVHNRKWTVMSIPSAILSAAYRPSEPKSINGVNSAETQSQLFIGDEEGFVTTITFLQPRTSLFRPKDTENKKDEFFWAELRFQTDWVRISSEKIHSCAVNQLQYFSDGEVGFSTSYDPAASIVLFWPTQRKSKTTLKLSHGATCVTMCRKRRTIVAGCRDGCIQVWPFPPSIPPVTLRRNNECEAGEAAICDVRFVSSWILSVDDKGVLRLWNIQTEKCIQSVNLPVAKLKSQAISSLPHTPFRLFSGPIRIYLTETEQINDNPSDGTETSIGNENDDQNSNRATGTLSLESREDLATKSQSVDGAEDYQVDFGVSSGTGVILLPFCPPPKPPPLLPLPTEEPRRVALDDRKERQTLPPASQPFLKPPDPLPQPGYPSSLCIIPGNHFYDTDSHQRLEIALFHEGKLLQSASENRVYRTENGRNAELVEQQCFQEFLDHHKGQGDLNAALPDGDVNEFGLEEDVKNAKPKPMLTQEEIYVLRYVGVNPETVILPPPTQRPPKIGISKTLYPAEAESLKALGIDPEEDRQQPLPHDLLQLIDAAKASVKGLTDNLSETKEPSQAYKSSEMTRLVKECAPHLALRLSPETPLRFSRILPMSTKMRARKLDLSEPKRLIAAKIPTTLAHQEETSTLNPLRALAHAAGSYMVGTSEFFKPRESNDEAFERLCRGSKYFSATKQK